MEKIKRISNEAYDEIIRKNQARLMAGFKRCKKCNCLFESAGNTFCTDCHKMQSLEKKLEK